MKAVLMARCRVPCIASNGGLNEVIDASQSKRGPWSATEAARYVIRGRDGDFLALRYGSKRLVGREAW